MENSAEETNSDNNSNSEESDGDNQQASHERPNEFEIKAHDLRVSGKAHTDVEELSDVCMEKMERVMEYALTGEMANLEDRGMHSLFLGGDD